MAYRPIAKVAAVAGATFLLSACADLYEPSPKMSSLNSDHAISNSASMRSTFVFNSNGKPRFCSEPQPDAGFSQHQKGDFSLSLVDASSDKDDGKVDESDGSIETEFAGREPSLLLTRELMYRLCEFTNNNELSADQAVDLYKQSLDIIKTVANTEATNTKVTFTETVTNSETVSDTETMSDGDGDEGSQ